MRRVGVGLLASLLLASCGGPEQREGALTADEEQQLNDAAAMLDEPEEEAPADAGASEGEPAE